MEFLQEDDNELTLIRWHHPKSVGQYVVKNTALSSVPAALLSIPLKRWLPPRMRIQGLSDLGYSIDRGGRQVENRTAHAFSS